MSQLLKYIKTEQKKINQALQVTLNQMSPSIKPIVAHILSANGKRIRPLLTILFARLFNYEADDIYEVASSLEMLHAATLLHDDIIDNADTRRSIPTAHTKFGLSSTVLGGDGLVARALNIIAKKNDPRLINSLTLMIEDTANGQILEIASKGQIDNNLDNYYNIIRGKTARMIACACEIGVLCANRPDLLDIASKYGLESGLAFQIVDDALDFASSKKTGKPEGGDIREGKFTPPIYFYYNSLTENEQKYFAAKFSQQSFEQEDIKNIAKAVQSSAFDIKTRDIATKHLKIARENLQILIQDRKNKNEARLLAELLDFVKDREA